MEAPPRRFAPSRGHERRSPLASTRAPFRTSASALFPPSSTLLQLTQMRDRLEIPVTAGRRLGPDDGVEIRDLDAYAPELGIGRVLDQVAITPRPVRPEPHVEPPVLGDERKRRERSEAPVIPGVRRREAPLQYRRAEAGLELIECAREAREVLGLI